jgi:hypothetical protein
MKILLNTDHLIEQAADPKRVPHFGGEPFALTAGDLHRWRDAIRKNSPNDWRFTEKGRDFVLTVVTDTHQIKIVGQSWRTTPEVPDLHQGIKDLAEGIAASLEPDPLLLAKLAGLYLDADSSPRAIIHHELKSVLATWMPPVSELARLSRETDDSILFAHSKVDRNLAQRPNAILIVKSNHPDSLLVRQGNPYVRLGKGRDSTSSYCIFARLTRSGIDPRSGQVWAVSRNGVLYPKGRADCAPTPRPACGVVPFGFRSENYWRVPLETEAWRYDLQKFIEKDSIIPKDEARRLLQAIELVRSEADRLNREMAYTRVEGIPTTTVHTSA